MADEVKFAVVQGAAPTSATTQDLTVSGFGTPVAAIFYMMNVSANDTSVNNCNMGQGFTDGTTNRSCAVQSQHNAQSTNSDRSMSRSYCVHKINTSGVVDAAASFDSWITDGVRIDWTDAPSSAFLINCVLIGGSEVTANVGESVIDSVTDVAHGLGAAPDLFFVHTTTGTEDSVTSHMSLSSAFMHYDGSTISQALMTSYDQSGRTGRDTNSYLSGSKIAASLSLSAVHRDWGVTSVDATNVECTRAGATSDGDIQWLALSFGSASNRCEIISTTAPTSATTKEYNTTDGWQPQFIMMFEPHLTSYGSDNTVDVSHTIGIIDDANEYCVSGFVDTVSDPSTNYSKTANKAIQSHQGATNDKVATVHTGSGSIDADGFTLDYTTANATAYVGKALVVEINTAAYPYQIHKYRKGGMNVLLTQ